MAKVGFVGLGIMGEPMCRNLLAKGHDVTVLEWIAWTPMLLLIVLLGVYPNIIFSVTDGAVARLYGA